MHHAVMRILHVMVQLFPFTDGRLNAKSLTRFALRWYQPDEHNLSLSTETKNHAWY